MLAYWNGHFICQYLSNYMGEYNPPLATLIKLNLNILLKDVSNWIYRLELKQDRWKKFVKM